MSGESNLKNQARSIFRAALCAADAGEAVRRFVKMFDSSNLLVGDDLFDLNDTKVYAIAIGKAAYPMALALDKTLGENLAGGVVSGAPLPGKINDENETYVENNALAGRWFRFAGGHPLPNEESLKAARSCFNLLDSANNRKSLVIFLVSGGGSAMVEMPGDESISLADLRRTNRLLVSCGATVAEINTVRRAVSLVKGGGLASRAPLADQTTLLVSDTEPGDEAQIASGPTFETAPNHPENARKIISRYDLTKLLPDSVRRLIEKNNAEKFERLSPLTKSLRRYRVLLDNQSGINAAFAAAADYGFVVETASDLTEQPVAEGCAELIRRAAELRRRTNENRVACLISGGEFSCPVKGAGIGGRNSETALRMALMLDESKYAIYDERAEKRKFVFLSAGTDGIDGNSPAAGAVVDETTIERARKMNLQARNFLDNSDAYIFFNLLGDTIVTGATGTNVRDLRILIAS